MTDIIKNLPLDPNEKVDNDDLTYLSKILKLPTPRTVKKVANEFKISLLAALLAVLIFGLPVIDNIAKNDNIADNAVVIMGIKVIIYVILFYIISKRLQQ